MEELYKKLAEKGLMDDLGNIVLDRYENGLIQAVDKNAFETFFGNVQPTYDALIGSHTFTFGDQTYTKTAEELGYKKYFDAWREKGII